MNNTLLRLLFSITAILITLKGNSQNLNAEKLHHHQHGSLRGELPLTYNDLFAGSGTCLTCHNDQVNSQGESISIITDWRSTMMANSARDPFWRAKVSHEGLVNPNHKEELENVCTRCHAPTGNENAQFLGQGNYSIAAMIDDPLALDGVQCTVCHQITEESLGNYSGTFGIGTNHIVWGPYENPFTNPMIMEVGYTPTHSNHITDSRLCAGCHTLITNSVDNNGSPTGNQFVEQAVYHEWRNSSYSANNESCQSCHVPRINDPVKISTRPPWLEPRTPFGLHHFAGANTFMLNILKDNSEELDLTATDIQFDSTIARNTRMLREKTIIMDMEIINRTLDSAFIELTLQNIAGHKFPSGYPSRRVSVELIVTVNSDTIFHSGKFDSSGDLIEENPDFEPHYDVIDSDQQVQIYELVMGDINYDVTTVLERANYTLKDNRLPPLGFTTSHMSYDTVKIVGQAIDDPNFNTLAGTQGTGIDIVRFHIPTIGITEDLEITANVYYQTVNPKWLADMFSYSSDEIDLFESFYSNADKAPFLITSTNITSIFTEVHNDRDTNFSIYPNPSSGKVTVYSDEIILSINIFNASGNKVDALSISDLGNNQVDIEFTGNKGLYLISCKTESSHFNQKVVIK